MVVFADIPFCFGCRAKGILDAEGRWLGGAGERTWEFGHGKRQWENGPPKGDHMKLTEVSVNRDPLKQVSDSHVGKIG